jgi:hypothetical protein
MEPPWTVKTLNRLSEGETVPSTMVPPVELLHEPLGVRVAQLATVTATLVPSGTVFPAASLMPEKVTDAVPPPDKEMEDGPDAVAEVVPGS